MSLNTKPQEANANLDYEAKADFLWKALLRFDFYIGSTHAKAALVIAFNTFVFSGIILKKEELLRGGALPIFGKILLLTAAISSLVSLIAMFLVINPYLKSIKHPDRYISNMFFQHIARRKGKEYQEAIENLDKTGIIEDLTIQSYCLAKGITKKFVYMRVAIGGIFVSLISLGVMLAIGVF